MTLLARVTAERFAEIEAVRPFKTIHLHNCTFVYGAR